MSRRATWMSVLFILMTWVMSACGVPPVPTGDAPASTGEATTEPSSEALGPSAEAEEVSIRTPTAPTVSTESNATAAVSTSVPSISPTVAAATTFPTASPSPAGTALSDEVRYSETSESPDGRWRAETVVSAATAGSLHVRFVVTNSVGTDEWVVVDEERVEGLGFPSPTVLHWLPEEQALFYTEEASPDGCSAAPYHTGLYRLDLTDGQVMDVANIEGYLAVSPDGGRVAYQPGGPMMDALSADWKLVVRDLQSGEEQVVPLRLDEEVEIVNFVWAPDGASLLLVTATGECLEQVQSISLLNPQTGALTPVLEGRNEPFYAVEWSDLTLVLLEAGDGTRVHLNVETGEIIDHP